MILVDVNLLIHAYSPSKSQHEAAKAWLESIFAGDEVVGLPWESIHGFLRISTNRRAFERPLTVERAASIVSSWLELPIVRILDASENHWPVLSKLLEQSQVSGPALTDVVLAALAIEHGATLCTTDRDFRRFDSLRLRNPLES